MKDLIILYYILSHPGKIQDLGFKPEYIQTADKKVLQTIYKELSPICKQYDQIIPLEKSLDLLSKPCYSNIKDDLLNTVKNMYLTGPDIIDSHSENDLDFYTKELINNGIQSKLLGIPSDIQTVIQNNPRLSQDRFMREIDHAVAARRDYFEDEENLTIYTNIFDNKFLDNTEEEKVMTGIADFDKYLSGGFLKKTISAVQTGTGKGKTTMLITLASNVLLQGYNVAFVNLEMREQELQFNIYSSLQTKYSYNQIKFNYNRENLGFVTDLQNEIKNKNIGYFVSLKNDSFESLNCKQIERKLNQVEDTEGYKFDIIFIDYIGLVQTYLVEKGADRSDQMAQRTMREFKIMCERNNWAGVTATQSNRGAMALGAKQSNKNQITNPMNYVSNSYASIFELDNFISIDRLEDTDLIKVTFAKHRQWHEKEEPLPFLLEYSATQKRYVNTTKQVDLTEGDIYSYKNIVDNLHNKFRQKDIIKLCEKFDIGPSSVGNQIKKYYGKKGYHSNDNLKEIDFDKLAGKKEFYMKFLENRIECVNGEQRSEVKDNNEKLSMDILKDENLFE